jgi:hypothetical protein
MESVVVPYPAEANGEEGAETSGVGVEMANWSDVLVENCRENALPHSQHAAQRPRRRAVGSGIASSVVFLERWLGAFDDIRSAAPVVDATATVPSTRALLREVGEIEGGRVR